jgi:hypothetical protein
MPQETPGTRRGTREPDRWRATFPLPPLPHAPPVFRGQTYEVASDEKKTRITTREGYRTIVDVLIYYLLFIFRATV